MSASSTAAAAGRISRAAKSRQTAWISRCSSVRSRPGSNAVLIGGSLQESDVEVKYLPCETPAPMTAPARSNARGAVTRARILAAAVDCLTEGGIDDVRIAKVAERAATSPASVHYHFATREALLAAAIEESFAVAGDVRTTHEVRRGQRARAAAAQGRGVAAARRPAPPRVGAVGRALAPRRPRARAARDLGEGLPPAAPRAAGADRGGRRRRRVHGRRSRRGGRARAGRDRRLRPPRAARRPVHHARARARARVGAGRGRARLDRAGVERQRALGERQQRVDLELGELRVGGGDARERGHRLRARAHVERRPAAGAEQQLGAAERAQERLRVVGVDRRERDARRRAASRRGCRPARP